MNIPISKKLSIAQLKKLYLSDREEFIEYAHKWEKEDSKYYDKYIYPLIAAGNIESVPKGPLSKSR